MQAGQAMQCQYMIEQPKQGIDLFAKPEQVLYRTKHVLITSYLGEVRTVVSEDRYLDHYNYSAAELFLHAIKYISGKRYLTPKHICFDIEEKLRKNLLLTNYEAASMSGTAKVEWYKQNMYCIQIMDDCDDPIRYAKMLLHLNGFFSEKFGITGSFEIRNTKCFALRLIAGSHNPISLNSSEFKEDQIGVKNGTLPQFLYALNCSEYNFLDGPIVDETNFSENITMSVTNDIATIYAVNNELKEYGLELVEVKRDLKMVFIQSNEKE